MRASDWGTLSGLGRSSLSGDQQRVGVLGGSFDPIHVGHLLIAEAVREALDLTHVLFIPAPRPWMKDDSELAPAEDRFEMVRLAIAGYDGFRLSRVDMDRPGPSYAVDTLRTLHGACPNATFDFIVGADALSGLPRWHEPHEMMALCRIAAVARPGQALEPVTRSVEAQVPSAKERIIAVGAPLIDVSSTDIRCRRRDGRSIRDQVPEVVEAFIRERGLYQA